MTPKNSGPAHEQLTPTGGGTPAPAQKPGASGSWLGSPSGIVALVALVLSVCLPPLFFPLAGLALVLAVIGLVRRRPRPRSAWVVAIISGVLLLVVLVIGILATVLLFEVEESSPGPVVPVSAPADQP